MADPFKMIITILDLPEEESVKVRIELAALPETMEHYEVLMEKVDEVWPKIYKDALVNVSEMLKRKEDSHG